MSRSSRSPFQTVRSEGGLLPADLLQRIAGRDRELEGLRDEDYHASDLPLNERIVRGGSIQANTIPSGHVATALAAGLAVVSVQPAAGSVLIASARLVPWMRTSAASPPVCTVSAPTWLSYCSQIQRRLAISGVPINVLRSAATSFVSGTFVGSGCFGVGTCGRS